MLKEIFSQKNLRNFLIQVQVTIRGIPGFRYVIMRILANLLMFIALIVCFDVFIDAIKVSQHSPWLSLGPIVGIIPFYYMHLTQNDYIDNHRRPFLFLGLISGFGILIVIFWILTNSWELFWKIYLPLSIAMMALIIGRHFVLSIYAVQKYYYVICLAIFFGLWLGFGIPWIGLQIFHPIWWVIIGIVFHAYGEVSLISKSLMHYI
jgi:hypothetical protein